MLINSITHSRLDSLNGAYDAPAPDPEILSIHYRSGEVKPGGLFVALKGKQTDGHQFIKDAVSRGAAAVVVSDRAAHAADVSLIRVDDTRKSLASISSKFYGDPSHSLFVIGITGTNGKTTIAYLIEKVLQQSGKSVGVIGTVNYRYQGRQYPNPLTTPESLELQKILSDMVSAGVTHVVMEVSSHGVALDRVWNCWFDIGVFTNLTQDHLDFHVDMENYWACKKMFFTDFLTAGPKRQKAIAVINCDHKKGRDLIHALDALAVIPVGHDISQMIYPHQVKLDQTGIKGSIKCPGGEFALDSRLVGKFNLENILCAVGVSAAMGIPLDEIANGVNSFSYAPGRLEPIPTHRNRHVFVDYAHTPDALENVLTALRQILSGRLICIFGCGGDRDKTKRPKMGSIAIRYSDLAIITSDNPRTENPDDIIKDILKGIEPSGMRQYHPSEIEMGFEQKGFVVEPDREKAIYLGIKASREGDTVLIAGKGHETYQIMGKQVFAFDDREKAAQALMVNYPMGTNEPIHWTADDILTATDAEVLGGEIADSFSSISIDSRNISGKSLFVAVTGERHDGHDFIRDAIHQGVKGILVSCNIAGQLPVGDWVSKGIWIAAASDTIAALGALAGFQRRRAGIPVVAITGSNGKTTTKEITAAVVGQKFNTLSTQGNLNNEIGLPLTLLRLSRDHEAAVVELGMNHPGEIRRLSEISRPDIGVITTIGPAHLEGLGTVEDVMHAKGELIGNIKNTGWLVLNGDNPYCVHLGESAQQKVVYFGLSDRADVRALDVKKSGVGSSFIMEFSGQRIGIELKLPGGFMVQNALAAATVGHLLGLSGKEIKTGIESVKSTKGRMELIETKKGISIIDDTYNANPGSMEAAIRTLISLKGDNRGVLVAGDMLELGEQASLLHEQIGKLAGDLHISKLFLTGQFAESLAKGARLAGMSTGDIVIDEKKGLTEKLVNYLKPGDWVLVKGSRSMGMEEIVQSLKKIMAS